MQANKQASNQSKHRQMHLVMGWGLCPSMFYILLVIVYESNTTFTLYSSEPNCAEPNSIGPAVHNHAGLVWSSSLQLSLMTVVYTLKQIGLTCMCWPTKMCQCKRSIIIGNLKCMHPCKPTSSLTKKGIGFTLLSQKLL